MLIFDVDDLYQGHDRMDLLLALKQANPLLKVTAFAVPALCPDEYVDGLPDWIAPIPHGFLHGDPPTDGGECRDWTEAEMEGLIEDIELSSPRWQHGFKAPGWILSDACYRVLNRAGWWVADQAYNNPRRPAGLRVHLEGQGDHAHHHVQDVCGNGLQESYSTLVARVRAADGFAWVHEMVEPWRPLAAV